MLLDNSNLATSLDATAEAVGLALENPNTIHPELVGVGTDLHLGINMVSGSRAQMQGTHYQQAPYIVGAEPRNLFVGSEGEYAKWMFNVVVEENCIVEQVIRRKAKSFIDSRDVLDIYVFVSLQDDPNVTDVIHIPTYQSNHQYFGWDYVLTDVAKNLAKGRYLRKGTVLAECPSVIDDEWCVGVNANAILVSDPRVIEDACVVSHGLCDRMLSYGYKTYQMFIGNKEYPLFCYGNEEDGYRIHPEVGEKVREDGILFAKRKYDPILAVVEMNTNALTEPCGHLDDCTFVDPNSEVVDIKVHRDDTKRSTSRNRHIEHNSNMSTPPEMQRLCDEYSDGLSNFYHQVREYYLGKKRTLGKKIKLSGPAKQLIKMAVVDNPSAVDKSLDRRKKQFGKEIIDDYMIEITVRYPIPLAVSGKMTDCMGGKGVIGYNEPDHLMPYDDFGNRVEIMMSDKAALRRTNFNRPFECYINAARRDVQIRVLDMVEEGEVDEAWDYLIGFCEVVSPRWAKKLEETHPEKRDREDMLHELKHTRLRMWIPINIEKSMAEIEREVEEKYPPRRSKLNIPQEDGSVIRSEKEFIIGELYMIRLDKTGREMSAVASGKFQHFGTISKMHSGDKRRRPISEQAIKWLGESEVRHQQAYIGGNVCAELHDRSNNPIVADEVTHAVLTAEVPTNIESAVDRKKFPLGHNRAMEVIKHVHDVGGVTFTNRKPSAILSNGLKAIWNRARELFRR